MDTPPQAQLRTDLTRLALPALVVTLGLQLLRVFIPSLAWYLRDTLGVGSAVLGACAFGTFLLGFHRRAAAPRARSHRHAALQRGRAGARAPGRTDRARPGGRSQGFHSQPGMVSA